MSLRSLLWASIIHRLRRFAASSRLVLALTYSNCCFRAYALFRGSDMRNILSSWILSSIVSLSVSFRSRYLLLLKYLRHLSDSGADAVPFWGGYAFPRRNIRYLLRLHLLIGAVFRYNLCRAWGASFRFCLATLFYRIQVSDAHPFLNKRWLTSREPPQHIF